MLFYIKLLIIISLSSIFASISSHTLRNGDCYILHKCQQDVIDFLQNSSISTSYHGQGLSWPSSNCGLIREKLGCIISLASTCPSRDNLTVQSTSAIVGEMKTFLQSNCYQNRDWTNSPCFASIEVKNCNNLININFSNLTELNSESCKNYSRFKQCIVNFAHSKCNNRDQDNVILYLIEKGSHLSWLYADSYSETLGPDAPTFSERNDQYDNHIAKRGSSDYEQNDRYEMLGRENLNANNHHQGSILFPSKQFPMDYLYPPSTNAQSMSTNLHPSPPLPPPLYSGQNVPGYYLPSQTQTTNAKLGAFSMDNRYNEKPVNMANYNQMPSGDKITISRPDINTDSNFAPINYGQAVGIQSRADKCVARARYVGRHCEEAISQSYRVARSDIELRDGKVDHCCGIKRFVECFGQILQQICPEGDANSLLEAIPTTRRTEISSCRPYALTQCPENDLTNQTFLVNSNLLLLLASLTLHQFN